MALSAQLAALRNEIALARAAAYDHAGDLDGEGRIYDAERAFGQVDAYDDVLARLDRL